MNPHNGETLTFASLGRLFEFLADQCAPGTPPIGLYPADELSESLAGSLDPETIASREGEI